MALKNVRIGSMEDIQQYDDADFVEAIHTEGPMRADTAPTAANEVLRLADIASLILKAAFPINALYLTVVSTNPNTLLGFGTWVRIAIGQFLVGYKFGDANFDPVGNTGGSLVTGVESATKTVDNNLDISTTVVASNAHTHDILPPFYVIYVWKRTV